jgi:hypothetical protein
MNRPAKKEGNAIRIVQSGARGPKDHPVFSADRRTLTVRVPLILQRRGGRKLVVSPDGVIGLPRRPKTDGPLVRTLARAHRWQRLLENGTYASVAEIANAEKINDSYVSRLMRLTLLAPDIVESILDGQEWSGFQVDALVKPMPIEWVKQRSLLGLS